MSGDDRRLPRLETLDPRQSIRCLQSACPRDPSGMYLGSTRPLPLAP